MKLLREGGEFGVITSETDVEVAIAASETVDGLVELAEAAGVTVTSSGPCEECGEKARLRDLAVQADGGGLTTIGVCTDCQDAKTSALVEQNPQPDDTNVDGNCEMCGNPAQLREFPLVKDGEFVKAGLCPDCQDKMVAKRAAKAEADSEGEDA